MSHDQSPPSRRPRHRRAESRLFLVLLHGSVSRNLTIPCPKSSIGYRKCEKNPPSGVSGKGTALLHGSVSRNLTIPCPKSSIGYRKCEGTNPRYLPWQIPTKLELVINRG